MSARPRRPVPSLPPAPPPLLRAHRPAHLGGILCSCPIPPSGPPHPACGASGRLDRQEVGLWKQGVRLHLSVSESAMWAPLSPQSEVSEGRQGRGRSTGDEESLAVLRR